MTKRRPLNLIKRIARNGDVTWYYWKRPDRQIRIRGEYGSDEFMAAYNAAAAGRIEIEKKIKERPETLAWLIARYRETTEWDELKPATKRQRENIFKRMIAATGDMPYALIDRALIVSTRDGKRSTPAAANNFMKTIRGLFRWALDAALVENDPTAGVKGVKLPSKGGFHEWSEEELDQFEARWPVGTRERLAMSIFLYTGLRRGDAAMLGKQHIKNGVITLRTEKTDTPIIMPVLAVLQEIIDASPTGDLALIAKADGSPMVKESLGNWFREACKAADVPGSAHGLRKLGATRCAYAGATIHELNAIFGWSGTKMAMHYTQNAERKRLAEQAANKLEKNKK